MKYQQGDVLFNEVSDKYEITKERERKYKYRTTGSNEEVSEPKLAVARKLGPEEEKPRYGRSVSFINEQGPVNKDVTVALGEVTGHSHTFYESDNKQGLITSFGANNMGAVGREVPSYVNIANGEGVIRHEEHDPITLPQGLYRVRIVREFDHLTQRTRNVVD